MAQKKYIVEPHDGEAYELSADHIEVNEHNSNIVTFYNAGGDVLAQENSARRVRPKNG